MISGYLGQWPHPKLFVTGENDDFSPPDKLAEFVATLPEPKTQVTLRKTGHFFEGREHDLAAVVDEFLKNNTVTRVDDRWPIILVVGRQSSAKGVPVAYARRGKARRYARAARLVR